MTQGIDADLVSDTSRKSRAPPADAWLLADAARAFMSDDDLAESERLTGEIEQKRETIFDLKQSPLDVDPSPTVKTMTGWDLPSATQAEIGERRDKGWSEDRIDAWMYSRNYWLRAAAHAPALTSAEIAAGSLREEFSSLKAAQAEVVSLIENRQVALQRKLDRELDLLLRRQEFLTTRGLLAALNGAEAIATGRRGSLRAPVDAIPASFWNNQLILEIDRLSDNPNSVFSTDGAILFTDVRIALAKKAQRQRAIAEGNKKLTGRTAKQLATWLNAEMAASPKVRPYPKNEVYRAIARVVFGHIAEKPFHACWKTEIVKTGAAAWSTAGAPGKSQAITKCEKLIARWVSAASNESDEPQNHDFSAAHKDIPNLSEDSFNEIRSGINSLYDRCKNFQSSRPA